MVILVFTQDRMPLHVEAKGKYREDTTVITDDKKDDNNSKNIVNLSYIPNFNTKDTVRQGIKDIIAYFDRSDPQAINLGNAILSNAKTPRKIDYSLPSDAAGSRIPWKVIYSRNWHCKSEFEGRTEIYKETTLTTPDGQTHEGVWIPAFSKKKIDASNCKVINKGQDIIVGDPFGNGRKYFFVKKG